MTVLHLLLFVDFFVLLMNHSLDSPILLSSIMDWATQRGPRPCQFVALERSRFSKIVIFSVAHVPLKLLVSLISRLAACSAKIVADRQTETRLL